MCSFRALDGGQDSAYDRNCCSACPRSAEWWFRLSIDPEPRIAAEPARPGRRPLRADARRNRARVLAGARELFADFGLETQMDDVARRASVGIGTIYRHFPTKEALVDAVITDRLKTLTAEARAATADPDPDGAFRGFLWRMAAMHAQDRAFAELVDTRADEMEHASVAKRELLEAVSALLAQAQAAGVLRPDVTAGDLPMLLAGVAHAVQTGAPGDPPAWERYLAIVLDGLRPPRR